MQPFTNRSNRIGFVVGLAAVAFAAGLALALLAPGGRAVPRVIGALGIVSGLFLLTSRNLFERDAAVPPDEQIRAERMARPQMRISGATTILMGMALFIADERIRTAVLVCAAALIMAGVFKVPRRFFS